MFAFVFVTLLNLIFVAEECAAGFQLTKEGSCEPCMRGYYRPKGAPACTKCPPKKTTPSISAKSEDECSEGRNLHFEKNIKFILSRLEL